MSQLQELLDNIPSHLKERCRFVNSLTVQKSDDDVDRHEEADQAFNTKAIASDGPKFVLYWLHHAMRAEENPSLDLTCWIANHLQLPVLVYQALAESEPYASDRHHLFVLQGARDLQQRLERRGITYAFHLQRRGVPEGYLQRFVDSAACVVTDEMPTEPWRGWVNRLGKEALCPVVAVDSSTVVSYHLIGKAYSRAFQFRDATRKLYAQRISLSPNGIDPKHSLDPGLWHDSNLLRLRDENLIDLLAECNIDHSIPPVADTVGGSTAGYDRWEDFKQQKLKRYAKERNNPLREATSRLSPYFHYGMIAPTRIAREAESIGGGGAEKYLDELLIWRELAYAYCYYEPDHGDWDALPEWAKETLTAHGDDRRESLFSWEELSRGQTGNELWDAAQHSLLLHGELHNNVRMTWGKALLGWTQDPQLAFRWAIDLNHRYALDGRDPASYGGLLWCFGLFDRPFKPEQPVFGTVRTRPTGQHAKRLDVEQFGVLSRRPLIEGVPRFAVIGAGLSGLIAARLLSDYGVSVTVFEKSRGVGGRMATRRAEDQSRFDHGAQYFTARDQRFVRYVESWIQQNVVQPWEGRIVHLRNGNAESESNSTSRYVGVPSMNSIAKHLASGLKVVTKTRIGKCLPEQNQWRLESEQSEDLGRFDGVISCAPPQQSYDLFREILPQADRIHEAELIGCWAIMLSFDRPLEADFDGAFVEDSPISWLAKNSSKPGRDSDPQTWVIHASPEWSKRHLELEADVVLEKLTEAFWSAVGLEPQAAEQAMAHRWRYSLAEKYLEEGCLFDRESLLGVCGDWCLGSRVEAAFLSGSAIAGRVLSTLIDERPETSLEQQGLAFDRENGSS